VTAHGRCSFAGLSFFASVDNLGFEVGKRGFFGTSIQKAYSKVNLKLRQGRMSWMTCASPYLLFVLPNVILFVWSIGMQRTLVSGPDLIHVSGALPFCGGVVGVYARMDYMIGGRPVYRQGFIENRYYVSTSEVGIQRGKSPDGKAFLEGLRRISLHNTITEQCRACPKCAMMLYANGGCLFEPLNEGLTGPTWCTTISEADPSLANASHYYDISPGGTIRFAVCDVGGDAVDLRPDDKATMYEDSTCRMAELGQLLVQGDCDEGTVRNGASAAVTHSMDTLRGLHFISKQELPVNDPMYTNLRRILDEAPPHSVSLSALAASADDILKAQTGGPQKNTFLGEIEGNREKAFHYFLYCGSKFVILRRSWGNDWRPSTAEFTPSDCSDAIISSQNTLKFSALKLTTEWSSTDPKRGDVTLQDFTVKQVSLPRMFGDNDPNDDMCNSNQLEEGDNERSIRIDGNPYTICQCKDDRFGSTCAFPKVCPEIRFTGLPSGFPSNFVLLPEKGSFNFELLGGARHLFGSERLDPSSGAPLGVQAFPSTTATSHHHVTQITS
jgi:hypothetical protein